MAFKKGTATIEMSALKNGGSSTEINFSLEIGELWNFPISGLFKIIYDDGSSEIHGTHHCPAVVGVSHERVTRINITAEKGDTKLY